MYPKAWCEAIDSGDFRNDNSNKVKQVRHLTEEQYAQVMNNVTLLRTYEKDGHSSVRGFRGPTEVIYVVVEE